MLPFLIVFHALSTTESDTKWQYIYYSEQKVKRICVLKLYWLIDAQQQNKFVNPVSDHFSTFKTKPGVKLQPQNLYFNIVD